MLGDLVGQLEWSLHQNHASLPGVGSSAGSLARSSSGLPAPSQPVILDAIAKAKMQLTSYHENIEKAVKIGDRLIEKAKSSAVGQSSVFKNTLEQYEARLMDAHVIIADLGFYSKFMKDKSGVILAVEFCQQQEGHGDQTMAELTSYAKMLQSAMGKKSMKIEVK